MLVECYEELRRQVLGEAARVRHSLGWSLFVRGGMASWIHAWPGERREQDGRLPVPALPSADTACRAHGELAILLAEMALACGAEAQR